MSNFAALIDVLSVAGSHLSTGVPNASGKVWCFAPGTNTTVNVYSDAEATTIVTQPIVLNAGGLLPSNLPGGVFTTQPIRLYIEDASGVVVSDNVFVPGTAGAVGVNNAGFTGDDLDDVLDAAFASFGGQDFKYKESGGATERTVKSKFSELGISVKDFGAVGDGVAIDTTAIQAAVSRADALGGSNVLFPPGTYRIDQAITATNADGIHLVGSGVGVTIIISTHATANVFTLTTCNQCSVEGITISNTGVSTGAAIAASACLDLNLRNLRSVDDYGYGLDLSAGSSVTMERVLFSAVTRSVRLNLTSTGSNLIAANIVSCVLIATDAASSGIEFNGVVTVVSVSGSYIQGGTNSVLFNAALSVGSGPFSFFGNAIANLAGVITAFQFTGMATEPVFRQWNNGTGTDGYVTAQASGGGGGSSFTPDRSRGSEIHLRLTSGGAAVATINAPTPAPAAAGAIRNVRLTLRITAAAGGAITARFNAVYIIVGGGTDIVIADGSTEVVEFQWDAATSEWRECFRSVTLT